MQFADQIERWEALWRETTGSQNATLSADMLTYTEAVVQEALQQSTTVPVPQKRCLMRHTWSQWYDIKRLIDPHGNYRVIMERRCAHCNKAQLRTSDAM